MNSPIPNIRNMSNTLIVCRTVSLLFISALVLDACKPADDKPQGKSNDKPALEGGAQQTLDKNKKPPKTEIKQGSNQNKQPSDPISVTVVNAEAKVLPSLIKATGTVVSLNTVDMRSQANSVIKQVHVKEGQFVKKGDLLFSMDARLDEANLAKAQAQMLKDRAALLDLNRQVARQEQLLTQNFISRSALDSTQASIDTQMALISADQAAVSAARVPLSYAKINAPSAGRVGAITVVAGSSVQVGSTPLLSITQLDPIAVSFNVPQAQVSQVLQALQQKSLLMIKPPESSETYTGTVQFVDSSIDVASGTIKVKALVKNPGNRLWPGSFVDVQLPIKNTASDSATELATLVIPAACIIQAARGAMVYAVIDGKAVSKPVEVLNISQGFARVKGLAVGERVVLEGRQNLRPDSPVVERSVNASSEKANINTDKTTSDQRGEHHRKP
jgi:RND family efflux transporter MFP subunit